MREPIKEDLKRRVRQRCGFGCVVCRSPIYDYEHIEDYAIVQKHEYENLVLLCPTCHRKKKKGLITRSFIIESRNKIDSSIRTSEMEIPEQPYTLLMGKNAIKMFSGCAFLIEGFGELRFKSHPRVLIDAVLFDKFAQKAIEVKDNHYTLCRKTWDIEYVGKTLTFRNGSRKVFASLTIDAESRTITLTGKVKLKNGISIRITDNGIFANKMLLARDNIMIQCKVGLVITKKKILFPSLLQRSVSGIFEGNLVTNSSGIAALNCTNCVESSFGHCNICFAWDYPFLETLFKRSS